MLRLVRLAFSDGLQYQPHQVWLLDSQLTECLRRVVRSGSQRRICHLQSGIAGRSVCEPLQTQEPGEECHGGIAVWKFSPTAVFQSGRIELAGGAVDHAVTVATQSKNAYDLMPFLCLGRNSA